MAIDVVLKDRNGNELELKNNKLYRHRFYISDEGEMYIFNCIDLYISKSTPFETYSELVTYLNDNGYIPKELIGRVNNDDVGKHSVGVISFETSYIASNDSNNEMMVNASEIGVFQDKVIPL